MTFQDALKQVHGSGGKLQATCTNCGFLGPVSWNPFMGWVCGWPQVPVMLPAPAILFAEWEVTTRPEE